MRKLLFILIPTLLIAIGAIVWSQARPPAPPIATPTITPNIITVGTSTQVLFTVSIPEPTLNPASVNLLRVASDGSSTVVAQMVDTGQNGDLQAGDKVFTARLTLNEQQPASFGFQVSAAFRGMLRRAISPVQQFVALAPTSAPVLLPNDPGEAGKATLAGIDSDGDGVRDDVQRFIILGYPQSEKTRAVLRDAAKAIHLAITSGSASAAMLESKVAQCLLYVRPADALDVLGPLEQAMLNTEARLQAYSLYESQLGGSVSTLPHPADRRLSCTFNPDLMGN